MTRAYLPDGGSFRDPSGRIYDIDGRILRTISDEALEDCQAFRDSRLYGDLSAKGMVIGSDELPPEEASALFPDAAAVIDHPRLPHVSYPYEWSFNALRDAAILHLDIQIRALEHGFVLSDASAYNVQFIGARPIFIDLLSFRRYEEGQYWTGHRQFCDQFLNPLLLRALLGVTHNAWYRGALEGIGTRDLARLLSWRHALSFNVLTQVSLHAWLENKATRDPQKAVASARTRPLSKNAYKGLLTQLHRWITRLKPKGHETTTWGDYADDNTYSRDETTRKAALISTFVADSGAKVVWDMGCNTGTFSRAALAGGAERVVGFDFDQAAVEGLYERTKAEGQNILPLWLDAANPSPRQGWRQAERKGFADRARADAVMALAFVHHLAIGRNIPLGDALAWLVEIAPKGVIEWVRKDDPTVRRMLALREDIFPDYREDVFRAELSKLARITHEHQVSSSGRILFFFDRRA